jgi:hypothetical protein
MIATRPLPPHGPEPTAAESRVRRLGRSGRLGWVALAALVPKCLVCAAAYTGLGAALGFGGPELCGAPVPGALAPLDFVAGLVGLTAAARLAVHLKSRAGSTRRPIPRPPAQPPAKTGRNPASLRIRATVSRWSP